MNPSEQLWNFLLESSKWIKFRTEEAIKNPRKISKEFIKNK